MSHASRCVVEVFTFLKMGGDHERCVVYGMSDAARASIATFDAAKARCHLETDRQVRSPAPLHDLP